MSGFKFGLQRVLDLRADRERDCALALVAAQGQADAARDAVHALEALRDEAHTRERVAGTVGQLRQLAYVREQVERRVELAAVARAAADQQVERSQQVLARAFQERRVLDRLRDKQLDAHRAGEVALDRQTMDDIALARFGRAATE